jgi:hypothetical protein
MLKIVVEGELCLPLVLFSNVYFICTYKKMSNNSHGLYLF